MVTFTGILLRLLPPFTKVRIPLVCRCDFFRRLPEMHGKEDGTVPATFQIIYMVCSTINASKRNPDAKRADWMETLSKPTETSRKGFRHQKPQRRALTLVWNRRTRIPSIGTRERKDSGFFLPWLRYNHLGSFFFPIIFWPFEFPFRHDTMKCFLPILRLAPMKEDLNDLVHG